MVGSADLVSASSGNETKYSIGIGAPVVSFPLEERRGKNQKRQTSP